MGGGSWSTETFKTFSKSIKTAPRATVFRSRSLDEEIDPLHVEFRESRDSDEHPNSTPIVVCFDVTGSMGGIPEAFVKELLGDLMDTLTDAGAVPDPQIMVGAVGDCHCDRAPLQITQWESDNRVAEWLTKIFLEGGGGGSREESYELAWFWFGYPDNTQMDSLEKRNQKGIFFTIGDEKPYDTLRASDIRKFTKLSPERDYTMEEIVEQIDERFHAFHIMITEGFNFGEDTAEKWHSLLGERAIRVDDYTTICDVIKGICLMLSGSTLDEAVEVATNKAGVSTALAPLVDSGTLMPMATGEGTAGNSIAKRESGTERL